MKYNNISEAIEADDIEAVRTFLPEHVNYINEYGYSALADALSAKNKEIFDLLLDYGADPHKGKVGSSGIPGWLYSNNWPDKLQKLVDSGYDLNSDKSLVISDVCRNLRGGHFKIIGEEKNWAFLKELLRCGARTDIPDEYGIFPLEHLSMKDRMKIEEYMINLANIETERQSNNASETGFAYDI